MEEELCCHSPCWGKEVTMSWCGLHLWHSLPEKTCCACYIVFCIILDKCPLHKLEVCVHTLENLPSFWICWWRICFCYTLGWTLKGLSFWTRVCIYMHWNIYKFALEIIIFTPIILLFHFVICMTCVEVFTEGFIWCTLFDWRCNLPCIIILGSVYQSFLFFAGSPLVP